MTIYVKDNAKSDMIDKTELIKWIESQYFHTVTTEHSYEAIVYHNGALKSVIRHINGDD